MSDDVPFNPRRIPGLLWWLDPNDARTIEMFNDGKVKVWFDKSSPLIIKEEYKKNEPVVLAGFIYALCLTSEQMRKAEEYVCNKLGIDPTEIGHE